MPTLTLLVEDEPGRGRWVHWDGIEVHPAEFALKIDAMLHGSRFLADCRYTRDGLVVREIKQALQQRGPTASERARRLLDQGRPREALARLDELPAGATETDPPLLDLRMRANAALKKGAEVGQDFARLLALPGVEPPDARRAFQILSPQARPFFALRFAQWAVHNFSRVKRWGADYVLEGVPVEQWPLELLLAELERLLSLPDWSAGLGDGGSLQPLLQRAQTVARNDPRVLGMGPRVRDKLTALADPATYERGAEAAAPADRGMMVLPPGWTPPK